MAAFCATPVPVPGAKLCRSVPGVEVLAALQSESDALPESLSLPFSVIKEMRAVTLRFIQFQMDREIKSVAFLDQFRLQIWARTKCVHSARSSCRASLKHDWSRRHAE